MPLQRPLPHRPGDHPGLAEPAAPRAAAEDLDAGALVHGLGERHERGLRVRPRVEVDGGALGDPSRRPVARLDARQSPVRAVGHGVERRHVAALDRGEPPEQLGAGATGGLPVAHDVGDVADDLLAVADRHRVDERRDRLRVERGVPAREDDRVLLAAPIGVQRDAREVQRGEQVGVAELGGEAHAEDVERRDGAVAVDGERGHAVLAHQRFEVGPDGVAALGQCVGALVEQLVEDLDALVGQPDLVGVRVEQRPPDIGGGPVLGDGVQLSADVLHRLGDAREERFQGREHGGCHAEPA